MIDNGNGTSPRCATLDRGILLGLLQMYETAIADLRRAEDSAFEGLILRLTRRQSEVIAEVAERQLPRSSAGVR